MAIRITCPVCKKVATIDSNCGIYCSAECREAARSAKYGWGEIRCKFNDYVNCGVHQCDNCGWNPEVEQKRKEAIYARYENQD